MCLQSIACGWPRGVEDGTNQVQRAPSSIWRKGRSTAPLAMHRWQPAPTAILAAAILVCMPPVPMSPPLPPAMASMAGVISRTRAMNCASGSSLGIGGVQAVDVGQQHQAIRPTIWATRAASRSLSP
jgi:hypothetical protein